MVRRGLLLLLSLLVWSAADAGRAAQHVQPAASCAGQAGSARSQPSHLLGFTHLESPQPDAAEDPTDEDGDSTRDAVAGGERPLASADLSIRSANALPDRRTVTRPARAVALPPSVTADAHALRGPPLPFLIRETVADRRVQLTD